MPATPQDPSFIRQAPIVLTGLRALLAPVVVLSSLYSPRSETFAACLIGAFLSDIFDGVIARRLGIATATLRRLDSAADTLFYAACVFAAWHLDPGAVDQRLVPLTVLAGLEAIRYAVDLLKFGREASYHMWSSKLWGIALFVGFFDLLMLRSAGAPVSWAIYVGIIADFEGLAISVVLRHWQADVPSIFHALRARQHHQRRTGGACCHRGCTALGPRTRRASSSASSS